MECGGGVNTAGKVGGVDGIENEGVGRGREDRGGVWHRHLATVCCLVSYGQSPKCEM